MDSKLFIQRFEKAFGNVELPVVFWYSSTTDNLHDKVNGCFFKVMDKVRAGEKVTLNADTIGCMGGKLYTGFSDFNERIANFVSLKEKYKRTPDMVERFVKDLDISPREGQYINFACIDKIDTFKDVEGLLFFATPDVLTGLASWTFFDTDDEDAVSCGFNSGCSLTVARVVAENRKGGKRCFLGFLDPSVRPYVESNILTYAIPMSRFSEMYETMTESCLFDTHAWGKVKNRINAEI